MKGRNLFLIIGLGLLILLSCGKHKRNPITTSIPSQPEKLSIVAPSPKVVTLEEPPLESQLLSENLLSWKLKNFKTAPLLTISFLAPIPCEQIESIEVSDSSFSPVQGKDLKRNGCRILIKPNEFPPESPSNMEIKIKLKRSVSRITQKDLRIFQRISVIEDKLIKKLTFENS